MGKSTLDFVLELGRVTDDPAERRIAILNAQMKCLGAEMTKVGGIHVMQSLANKAVKLGSGILTDTYEITSDDFDKITKSVISNGHKSGKPGRQLTTRWADAVNALSVPADSKDKKTLFDGLEGSGTIQPVKDKKLIDCVRRYLQGVPKMSVVTMQDIMKATGLSETQVPPIVATLRANKILRRVRNNRPGRHYKRGVYVRMAGADATIAKLLKHR